MPFLDKISQTKNTPVLVPKVTWPRHKLPRRTFELFVSSILIAVLRRFILINLAS